MPFERLAFRGSRAATDIPSDALSPRIAGNSQIPASSQDRRVRLDQVLSGKSRQRRPRNVLMSAIPSTPSRVAVATG